MRQLSILVACIVFLWLSAGPGAIAATPRVRGYRDLGADRVDQPASSLVHVYPRRVDQPIILILARTWGRV